MVNCIVAVEKSQGIGFKGSMPWPRLTDDMKWFKEQTLNNVVIMGRKTWESIGNKKLPNRINIVLSQNKILGCDMSLTSSESNLENIKSLYPNKEIFIIGGSAIYELYLKSINKFYITEIEESYECDTYFNLEYVRKNFTNIKKIATFNTPIKYTIKEYTP